MFHVEHKTLPFSVLPFYLLANCVPNQAKQPLPDGAQGWQTTWISKTRISQQ